MFFISQHALKALFVSSALLVVGALPARAESQWLTFIPNSNPPYMVGGGLEQGRELFVCRAVADNTLLPGKTWRGLNSCAVTYGNQEVFVPIFQVLLAPPAVSKFSYRWAGRNEIVNQPTLMGKAVQGGFGDGQGERGICRMTLQINGQFAGVHPGRFTFYTDRSGGWCFVSWGGRDYSSNTSWDLLLDQ